MKNSHRRERFMLSAAVVIAALGASACKDARPGSVDQQSIQTQPLSPIEKLGKNLFFDNRLSNPQGQSCASCHSPEVGWTGGDHALNQKGSVYPGAEHSRFGNRKPPSIAYAFRSPPLRLENGEFFGGLFWDGSASGVELGNPLAEQAMGPFLNPLEQNLPGPKVICERVAAASYVTLYADVWGQAPDCSTPAEVDLTFESVAHAIAAFESSSEVSPYSSKYDAFLPERAELSPREWSGLILFNGKAKCSHCHSGHEFTDYSYANLGVPRNPENPFYRMDRVLINGTPINPDGEVWADPGLGGFLATQSNEEWKALARDNLGKHKVPTLRNVALGPSSQFVKAYMHNGVFKSLKEVVHFYNTRDLPGQTWGPPEYPDNTDGEHLGDLGLTSAEEDDLVLFLKTLSDGWQP